MTDEITTPLSENQEESEPTPNWEEICVNLQKQLQEYQFFSDPLNARSSVG
jgi:hypothetical protein